MWLSDLWIAAFAFFVACFPQGRPTSRVDRLLVAPFLLAFLPLGDEELPGLLPEGRSGPATGRNILAAFQGLGFTYTHQGIAIDRLTPTQRRILELLEIEAPWPEQGELAA